MMRLALLALALLVTAGPAWAQGAGGERRFNQQLHDVRRQVQPHFRSIRGSFADLRAQGVNTSQWERQLNYAESLLNNMRWQGGGGGKGLGLQTINPFGDYLFHGVPVTPSDGRLVTRHLDPTGLAQRAEEWAKMLRDPYQLIARADEMAGDMRLVTEHLKTRQGAELEKFKKDLNNVLAMAAGISRDELKAADLGGGGRDLKPKALGDDTSDAPRLSGDTPMLLRDPFEDASRARGQPILGADAVPPPPVTAAATPSGAALGTVIGESSAQWYADQYAATGKWYYGAGGLAASLWTPDTWKQTALTLGPTAAGLAVRGVAALGTVAADGGVGLAAKNAVGIVGAEAEAAAAEAAATRTVLSGHGGLVVGGASPVTVVPPGTSVTFYGPHGAPISDALGNAIETGKQFTAFGARTYLPGAVIPNYTLYPPTGLNVLGNPTTVTAPTALGRLLRPGMGNVEWAACCVIQGFLP